MTQPTIKILLALLTFAMMTGAASAQQQRTYYDARGNSLGRSTPDSQGTVTNTDSRGRTPLLGGGSETFRKLRAPEGFRSPVGKPGRAHRFCSGLPVGNWAELGISGHFS